ncbi:succinyl-diaminopimelate desuccinylase [Thalassotalea loyana]|uniref:Succinyl-diaminopimelate desuccinylase n=1 Tax=Thalassotalea loyana TaxID=280483 RepID=A0ABQ6HGI0_9GAMM|nr:succinyl-diaminopimelate desuccinylase [Thalassotalea loyana]GLX87207.1 succinyl-diaminopimelate desuccinylase [Thalassotalea loyana]
MNVALKPLLTPCSSSVVEKPPAPREQLLGYAKALINRKSITPDDGGCHSWLIAQLEQLGFECTEINRCGVKNFIATYGTQGKAVAFAGHTDVVPPGDLSRWKSDPFIATINHSTITGRGAADMKTGIAAMLSATKRLLGSQSIKHRLIWLITSDEEGEAEYGTKLLKDYLDVNGVLLDYCIVGEPTATKRTGDTIKVGRRGSLSCEISIKGKQGHVAYPQYAQNALHIANKVIQSLVSLEWDMGCHDFPGTSLQITHIDSGEFTDNIIPGQSCVNFNIRYSASYSQESLQSIISKTVSQIDKSAQVTFSRPCLPYLTHPRDDICLIDLAKQAVCNVTGIFPTLSTSGGTSDGRFIADSKTQVIELGVPNSTIHQVNESINIDDLISLEAIYFDLLLRLSKQA